jgi:hypothetical protein
MANSDTLKAFLDTLNDQQLPRNQKIDRLMGLFCEDRTEGRKEFPCLGITDHGPAFKKRHDVAGFFDQLLRTFPNMTWTPVADADPLTSTNEIGIQMDVKGKHSEGWFAKGNPHYSLPLSELDHGSHKTTEVPAFGVFSFDQNDHGGAFRIRQIQIYMDRYKMMHDVAPDHWTSIHLPRGQSSAESAQSLPQEVRSECGRGRRITIVIDG